MKPLLIFGAFGIGIVAGLRAFTAPAMLCWATHFGWVNLSDSRLAFLGRPVLVGIVSLLAVGELIADKLPMTPNRTATGPLLGRIASGAFSAFAMATAAQQAVIIASFVGVAGALAGAFGGYYARHFLVKRAGLPDFPIAMTEDLIAVGGAFCLVRQMAWQ